MNEVKVSPVVAPQITRVTSSEESSSSVKKTDVENGNNLPLEKAEVVSPKKAPVKTEQVVEEVNQFVQSVQRDLHFSVDEDSGITIIRVRDKESGELIRQIPEDIFLNLAQNLKQNQSLQLLDTHG